MHSRLLGYVLFFFQNPEIELVVGLEVEPVAEGVAGGFQILRAVVV